MIELYEKEIQSQNRQSSKGNQMKWLKDEVWYKADFTGYEGLTEYIVSALLKKSTLDNKSFQRYEIDKIKYKYTEYLGCSSKNFLPVGWQLITLERLFMNTYGESLNKSIYRISELEERIRFLVDQTRRITGLQDFDKYMCHLMTIDALFLNEDRHTHNIAVLIDAEGEYQYCPIFDNGGGLLSDTTMDYPLNIDTQILMKEVKSKTFCQSFDDQLDVIEKLYGLNIKFNFTIDYVEELLDTDNYYSDQVKARVIQILRLQKSKYQYLFE